MAREFHTPIRPPALATAPTSPAQGWCYVSSTNGHLYCYDGSAWVDCGASGGGVPTLADACGYLRHIDHCSFGTVDTSGTSPIQGYDSVYNQNLGTFGRLGSSAGSGAGTNAIQSEAGHPGIIRAVTGTSGTANRYEGYGGGSTLRMATLSASFFARIRVPTLSDATDRFTDRAGWLNTLWPAYGLTDGCFFRYTDNVNSGRWECVCIASSTETASDSGVYLSANTWVDLLIEINAAGTSVVFSINGSVVATVTTNIPGASPQLAPQCNIRQASGSNSRSLDMDVVGIQIGDA
jgi:hypothetical protein